MSLAVFFFLLLLFLFSDSRTTQMTIITPRGVSAVIYLPFVSSQSVHGQVLYLWNVVATILRRFRFQFYAQNPRIAQNRCSVVGTVKSSIMFILLR